MSLSFVGVVAAKYIDVRIGYERWRNGPTCVVGRVSWVLCRLSRRRPALNGSWPGRGVNRDGDWRFFPGSGSIGC